jgi:L-arabinose transport system substrate-binding protein
MGSLRASITTVIVICGVVGALVASGYSQEPIKIGFIVKQPEESWFQNEWKFAELAAKKYGFTLIKIGATDGEKVLSAIENLKVQRAQGFVICTPDVKLGSAILARATSNNMKIISVDDRFVDSDGLPLGNVHHMGISAYRIGETVGDAMYSEYKKRGWRESETGVIAVTYYELRTAKERVQGALFVFRKNNFSEKQIFFVPQRTTDTPGGFDAVNVILTKNPHIRHWIICALNDETVIGGVRATEGRGIKVSDVIAVGINGQAAAISEFKKSEPTGFCATILLSARKHGYETTEMMYKWIANGEEPPLAIFTVGILIDRNNWRKVYKEQGLEGWRID